MPWKNFSVVAQRGRFVQAVMKGDQPFGTVCGHFGISRQCGYKWMQRFHRDGRSGLRSRSPRPRRSPTRLAKRWQVAIRRLRRRFPQWGPKKIRAQLRRAFPRARLPVVRTITRWLPKLCPGTKRWRHSRRGPRLDLPPLSQATAANQVWTVDFKGFFRTGDGTRCDPLTVRDLYSRFLLAVHILPHQRYKPVRRVFLRLFGRFGLPKVIRVDNGTPFGSTGARGLSTLSLWWITLGIQVEFIRPGHPEDNAGHEQMHREFKRDNTRPAAAGPRAQQRRAQRWSHYYNFQRPHEALQGQYPAELYRPSRRPYRGPRPFAYPRGGKVRYVRHNGQIKWQGRYRFIGEAFVGQAIGLQLQAPGVFEVHFRHLLLGTLHDRDAHGLRPVKPRRQKT